MFHLHYKQVLTIHTPVQVLVIVKKSSPKNLSADCRSTVGRQVAYISGKTCWPSVDQLSTNCRDDCRPTVDWQSADRFFGELFFTITQVFYHKQINLRPWAKPVSHTPAHLSLSHLKSSHRWRYTYSAEPTLRPACILCYTSQQLYWTTAVRLIKSSLPWVNLMQ